jgi:hypothetical protein
MSGTSGRGEPAAPVAARATAAPSRTGGAGRQPPTAKPTFRASAGPIST